MEEQRITWTATIEGPRSEVQQVRDQIAKLANGVNETAAFVHLQILKAGLEVYSSVPTREPDTPSNQLSLTDQIENDDN